MANIQSAIKRARQSEKRHRRNRMVLSKARTATRKAMEGIAAGDKEQAAGAVKIAISEIDKAAQKGVIHKNAAARRKSRLMAKFNSLS